MGEQKRDEIPAIVENFRALSQAEFGQLPKLTKMLQNLVEEINQQGSSNAFEVETIGQTKGTPSEFQIDIKDNEKVILTLAFNIESGQGCTTSPHVNEFTLETAPRVLAQAIYDVLPFAERELIAERIQENKPTTGESGPG